MYKWRKCDCQFAPTRHKERREQKNLWQCECANTDIRSVFKVNVHSAFVWVKKFAKNNYSKPASIDNSVVINLDEMWHFLRSKKDKFGFGKLTAEQQNILLIGSAAHKMRSPLEKCTND